MLPKIDVPIFEVNLPLMKKKVKYRPFLVKEEKILLMAMESKEETEIALAIKQIVNNCVITKLDIDELPIVDLEYLFLHLRARSIGEIIELQYQCNNNVSQEDGTEKKCGALIKFELNALEIAPETDTVVEKKIQLTENLGVVMKYPNYKMIENLTSTSEAEMVVETITSCIDYIYDNDGVYYAKDVKKEELVDFIDSLTREQFEKIQNFFENIPKLRKKMNFVCGKCGYKDEITLEGIQSFFV